MHALAREVPRSISEGERTHVARTPVDLGRAREEHARYLEALEELGCEVVRLPELPDLPDSVFVEDTAVVLDELAILTRPGAPSRRPEVDETAAILAEYRPLARIPEPATLDGGDVLVLGRRIHVGVSSRTDARGVQALRELAAMHGYDVRPVPVHGALHLKSAVSVVGKDHLLVQPAWVDPGEFRDQRLSEVDPREPFAANAVHVNGRVILPEAFPRTRERLERAGVRVVGVPAAELAKAEGGVTCCSLLVPSGSV